MKIVISKDFFILFIFLFFIQQPSNILKNLEQLTICCGFLHQSHPKAIELPRIYTAHGRRKTSPVKTNVLLYLYNN